MADEKINAPKAQECDDKMPTQKAPAHSVTPSADDKKVEEDPSEQPS